MVKTLIEQDSDVNKMCMYNKKNLTPLMLAAQTNSEESLNLLLDKKADPDMIDPDPNVADEKKSTALIFAILEGNTKLISILFKVTNKNIKLALMRLAESDIDWKSPFNQDTFEELKKILNSKINQEIFHVFLKRARRFGNQNWLEWLLKDFNEWSQKISKKSWLKMCKDVIKSGNGGACKVIADHMTEKKIELSDDLKKLAKRLKIKGVLHAFGLLEQNGEKAEMKVEFGKFPCFWLFYDQSKPCVIH